MIWNNLCKFKGIVKCNVQFFIKTTENFEYWIDFELTNEAFRLIHWITKKRTLTNIEKRLNLQNEQINWNIYAK